MLKNLWISQVMQYQLARGSVINSQQPLMSQNVQWNFLNQSADALHRAREELIEAGHDRIELESIFPPKAEDKTEDGA